MLLLANAEVQRGRATSLHGHGKLWRWTEVVSDDRLNGDASEFDVRSLTFADFDQLAKHDFIVLFGYR